MCPTLEDDTEQVNCIGGFSRPPQGKYDPYSNNYNPEFSISISEFSPELHFAQQNSSNTSGTSLEEVVKAIAFNTQQEVDVLFDRE